MRDLIYMFFKSKMVEFSCFIYNMCTRCPKKTKIVVVIVIYIYIYIYTHTTKIVVVVNPKKTKCLEETDNNFSCPNFKRVPH